MLQQVQLRGIKCFGDQGATLGPMAPVNLLFGPNGSGKTSISRALHDPKIFPTTEIYESGLSCKIQVYNRDYVSRTFGTSDSLPGIFMLGSNAQDILDQIETAKKEYDEAQEGRALTYALLLGGEKNIGEVARLEAIEAEYREAAWKARDSVPPEIDDVIRSGTKNNKVGFMQKCEEVADASSSSDVKLADLIEEATSLFDPDAEPSNLIPEFSTQPPSYPEAKAILGKRILASQESPLSDLVAKLENDAWVQQGVHHFQRSEGICPFCQQKTPDTFSAELAALFDATYENDKAAVERLARAAECYKASAYSFIEQQSSAISVAIDTDLVMAAFSETKAFAGEIARACEEKLHDLASVVQLDEYGRRDKKLTEIIASANSKIEAKNQALTNREEQARKLTRRCWTAFVRDTLSTETSVYIAARDARKERINVLRRQLEDEEHLLAEIGDRLIGLQHQTRTSRKVMESVNLLLERVGFRSFKLDSAHSPEVEGAYRIVRPDDGVLADVKDLSEGERTFITFMYFYHSIQAITEEGEQQSVVAVIDDPISSLDSDIMFIVSSLVRAMCDDIRTKNGRVAQLVLLTHNTRFHREVSEHLSFGAWTKKNSNHHCYFRLKKTGAGTSELVPYGKTDPVRSIYQTLWDEIAVANEDPNSVSTTLPNVMRRILETYVEMVGGINKKEIEGSFPEDERILCRSLLAWTNSGSHRLLDDDGWETSSQQNSIWVDIFHRIFTYSHHERHYEKMLGKASE